jgi:hypothetical protein
MTLVIEACSGDDAASTTTIDTADITGVWRDPSGFHLVISEDGTYRAMSQAPGAERSEDVEWGTYTVTGSTLVFTVAEDAVLFTNCRVRDTRISSSSGYSDSSHREIWAGDHHNESLSSTTPPNRGHPSSFIALGRFARLRDARCAATARYRSQPPLILTSRDTVEDDRPRRREIDRSDSPPAIPREISSRSPRERRNKHQSPTGTGRFHPDANNLVLIVAGARSNALPMDR